MYDFRDDNHHLFSQVNKVYHHPSLGVEIEVVVKKIIVLEPDMVSS